MNILVRFTRSEAFEIDGEKVAVQEEQKRN